MQDSNPVATPVSSGSKLMKVTNQDELVVDIKLYQSAIGSLQYLSTMTRPDVTFALSNVTMFNSKPMKEHWTAVKCIFRYQRYGLLYNQMEEKPTIGYSDSDWAGDLDDCKPLVTDGGTAISWRSKKQSCVAFSTTEAEYIALSQAAQEATWLQCLNNDLKLETSTPTLIYNQSAICIAKNPQSHGRLRHIDKIKKYHFIREQGAQKNIEVKYRNTKDMVADLMTKSLGKERFEKLRSLTGLTEQSD